MGIYSRCWAQTFPTYTCSDRPTWKCCIGKWEFFYPIVFKLNIIKTGEDAETLRRIESLIQAGFRNGLPPHLQPNANSITYAPESDQSRIFVTSHSEFSSLGARDIQKILRDRLILVHGNPLDYAYGWDLHSIGRVYDVDRTTTVHGEMSIPFIEHVLKV